MTLSALLVDWRANGWNVVYNPRAGVAGGITIYTSPLAFFLMARRLFTPSASCRQRPGAQQGALTLSAYPIQPDGRYN